MAIEYLQNRRCALCLEHDPIDSLDRSLLQRYKLLCDRLNH
jgi:hypothetical protein